MLCVYCATPLLFESDDEVRQLTDTERRELDRLNPRFTWVVDQIKRLAAERRN